MSGTITITGAGNDDNARRADERNKGVIFKNCAKLTDCMSEINNVQIDSAELRDAAMPMYNLIEYRENYSKISGSLRQYYRDEPNDNITESESFKSKIKIKGNTLDNGNTKNVELTAPCKYLRNF